MNNHFDRGREALELNDGMYTTIPSDGYMEPCYPYWWPRDPGFYPCYSVQHYSNVISMMHPWPAPPQWSPSVGSFDVPICFAPVDTFNKPTSNEPYQEFHPHMPNRPPRPVIDLHQLELMYPSPAICREKTYLTLRPLHSEDLIAERWAPTDTISTKNIQEESKESNGELRSESLPILKVSSGTWKCAVCGKELRRRQRAVTHYWNKHGGMRVHCQTQCGLASCNKLFASQEGLDGHLDPVLIDCPSCGKSLLKKNILRHKERHCHSGETIFIHN